MMQPPTSLDRCFDFIKCHSTSPRHGPAITTAGLRRMITISRQAGTGAHALAEELVARLQPRAPEGSCPWTIFDKNLVDKVLEDHDLPSRLATYMREDRASELSDFIDELFGLHPHSWSLVRKTADTILHLAELGNVIVIGRGATVVTRQLDHAFHIRLIGSLDKRIERVHVYEHMSLGEASAYVHRQDLARRRYLKKYYSTDIDDPLLYHMVINTDRVPHSEAAEMIAEAVYPHVSDSPTIADADVEIRRPEGARTRHVVGPVGGR
jgi:cytidylate kinase